jgi:hypothetical protein
MLAGGRVGVHLELGPDRDAGGVETPGKDLVVLPLSGGGPGDDETAVGQDRCPRSGLVCRGSAEPEFRSPWLARGGETSPPHAATLGRGRLPHHHEVSRRIDRDIRPMLVAGGFLVDLELGHVLRHSPRIVPSREHTFAAPVVRRGPHHHERARRAHGYGGAALACLRLRVHAESKALRVAPVIEPPAIDLVPDAADAGHTHPDDHEVPGGVRGHVRVEVEAGRVLADENHRADGLLSDRRAHRREGHRDAAEKAQDHECALRRSSDRPRGSPPPLSAAV